MQLLRTARAMLVRDMDLESVSLNELARRAQMAKSNVYRYFETREALLLALLWEEWGEWYREFFGELKMSGSFERSVQELVSLLARSLVRYPLLCALTAALPTVLERNLSESAIRKFKRDSLEFFLEIGSMLEAQASGLSSDSYAQLLHDGACLMAGLYPHAYPSKAVARALKAPELQFFRRDFAKDLERVMLALAFAPAAGLPVSPVRK